MSRETSKGSLKFFVVRSLITLSALFCVSVAAESQMGTDASYPRGADPGTPANVKTLQIAFIDVEGGQATLFVTPSNKSLLIDTGWPGFKGRDAERIAAIAKQVGLKKIDYVLITHYHMDHAGGAVQLAERIPIGTFIDYGENHETDDPGTREVWQAYQRLLADGKYKHIVARPGDTLPVEGIKATVVSGNGEVIAKPVRGHSSGKENAACKGAESYPEDQTENARSLGLIIDFGRLRIVDLGDLTRDKEKDLVCPLNKLGKADIYIVSHHGSAQSGSPAFLAAIDPRVAIMNNGEKKGGSPEAWDIIKKSPHLQDLWQLHFSLEGGAHHNAPLEFIANPPGSVDGTFIQIQADSNGGFKVINPETNNTKFYEAQW